MQVILKPNSLLMATGRHIGHWFSKYFQNWYGTNDQENKAKS